MKHPKNENKRKNKRKMSMQKICVVYAVLPGNHLKICKMIPFGLRAQEKPAKCKSTAACKQSATGKCMTDV